MGVTAARSQESLADANGKRDLNVASITPTPMARTAEHSFSISIFPFSTAIRARSPAPATPSPNSRNCKVEAAEQVMTDVVDAYEALHSNDQIIQLYRSVISTKPRIARYHRVRLPARRRQPARFSGCRAHLSRQPACLPPGARQLYDGARTDAPSRRNEEPAMKISKPSFVSLSFQPFS